MPDKALADAIAALAKSQLLTVDVLRGTQSTTQVMAERLGVICDQNSEILSQLKEFGGRVSDSERQIRVFSSELSHVKARLSHLEADTQAAKSTATRST